MDPYFERILGLLGEHDPIEVLQSTPLRVEELFERFRSYDLEASYEPGKWSARQILAHLADVELAHAFRFRQILADDSPVIQPFDQDRWAERYRRTDPAVAAGTFRALRSWNLALLATMDLDDWLREGLHPERGTVSMDLLVRSLAGHDLNHLVQLERIASGA